YWRDADDLAAYDAILAERIAWKWDAVLAELGARGVAFDRPAVLDFGCGTGIAARRFARVCAVRSVTFADRSPLARAFALERFAREQPGIPARAIDAQDAAPDADVLLVSHVLGELGDADVAALIARVQHVRSVVWVEPGSRAVSRRLSELRDALLGAFDVVAPCTHRHACPALSSVSDWCHFFARPPAAVFTDGVWVRIGRELGIDLRAVPYAFLALVRRGAAPVAPPPAPGRILGRPRIRGRTATVHVCDGGLHERSVLRSRDPELFRRLERDRGELRWLPPADR